MASGAAAEKTADELRKEIQELQRQHREINERLRDPRGIRRGGAAAGGPRPVGGGPRQRGLVRPAEESEEEPVPKRRLLSTIVKADGEEVKMDASSGSKDSKEDSVITVTGTRNHQTNGEFKRESNQRMRKTDFDIPPPEPLPRVFPKNEDPSLVKRNRRMLGQLLGTLEKFREEDKQISNTEAYMRRSDSLKRAEQRAREESEKLRKQQSEQIEEKRRRDLTLRARVAAKAEEKRLELLFIKWAEHHKNLSNYLRTKAEPPIYYMPAKPLVEQDIDKVAQRKEQEFLEWKSKRRAELTEFQKQVEEQYLSSVDKEMERWQNARKSRRPTAGADVAAEAAETMDKELETHRLEHGPKTRRGPPAGGNGEEEEDLLLEEDEFNMMDDEELGHDAHNDINNLDDNNHDNHHHEEGR